MGLDSQPSSAVNDDVVLTTPRMVLRAIGEADIPRLHQKIFSVPEVMKWVFGGAVLAPAESESFIRANFNFRAAPTGLCALADKVSGGVIGFAGLNPCRVLSGDDLEIGFVLARSLGERPCDRNRAGATRFRVPTARTAAAACAGIRRERGIDRHA